MPHGLGEDPLSRQRKNRKRAASQFVPGGDASGPHGPAVASPIGGGRASAAGHLPMRPTNYNDIFFRKRSESDTAPKDVSSPQPEHAEVPDVHEEAPVAPTPARMEATPAPVPIESPVVATTELATGEMQHAPENQPTASLEPAAGPADSHEGMTGHKEAHEGGILKRIFGRFHK